jgi:hypothetical protein
MHGIVDEGTQRCTGSGGCSSEYELEFCTTGCACGNCVSHGGSGLCCDHIYYTPSVQRGIGDCDSEDCGFIAVHARTHLKRHDSQYAAQLRDNYSRGLILLQPNISFREPLFAYGYNRRKHSYRLIAE